MIRVESPQSGAAVTDPIIISGQARGTWFFEASFPASIEDAAGTRLAVTPAMTSEDWMTTDFVPFEATLDIPDGFSGSAILVLEKDNPSGLLEHADMRRIPIVVSR
jgi:hypothetical protein